MRHRTVALALFAFVLSCTALKSLGSAVLADLGKCTGQESATALPQLTSLVQSGNQTSIENLLTSDLGQDAACTLNSMAGTVSTASTGSSSLSAQAGAVIKTAIQHGKLKSSPRPASAACPQGNTTKPAAPHPETAAVAPVKPAGQ